MNDTRLRFHINVIKAEYPIRCYQSRSMSNHHVWYNKPSMRKTISRVIKLFCMSIYLEVWRRPYLSQVCSFTRGPKLDDSQRFSQVRDDSQGWGRYQERRYKGTSQRDVTWRDATSSDVIAVVRWEDCWKEVLPHLEPHGDDTAWDCIGGGNFTRMQTAYGDCFSRW